MLKYLFGLILFVTACNSKKAINWTCDGNCDNGVGTKQWEDGGIDKGTWKNGHLSGEGYQFFGTTSQFAGDTYTGSFGVNGYEGQGTYYSKKGDSKYVGEWKDSKPNGKGILTWGKDSKFPDMYYDGDWKNGKQDGHGTKFWGSAGKFKENKYVGDWKNDTKDGNGKYYWPNGDYYDGSWENGLRNGKGTFVFKNGEVFKGYWEHGICEAFDKKFSDR